MLALEEHLDGHLAGRAPLAHVCSLGPAPLRGASS